MKFIFFLTFFCSFQLFAAVSTSLPSYCNSEAVHIIDRPFYSKKEGPTFKFRFSVSVRDEADLPLVIFIPGGPGQTSMNMPLSYPNEFAVVRTDPRGVGCNQNLDLPEDALTSEEIAEDILAIIRTLRPKKYLIHAISYGTIPATILASKIEKENLPQPSAVILEGSVGKFFEAGEYFGTTLALWKSIKPRLSQKVRDILSQKQLPFGLSSKEWAAWLNGILSNGILPDGSDYAFNQLMLLDSTDPEVAQFLMKNVMMRSRPADEVRTRLFKTITCHEIAPDMRDVVYDFDILNGDLVISNKNLCAGISLDRPYDSKNFQIKAPIYYFSGGLDPLTPPPQASYHFQNQSASRTLIKIKNAGHTALSTNLMDCSNPIWISILNNDYSEIVNTLKTCQLATEVTIERR